SSAALPRSRWTRTPPDATALLAAGLWQDERTILRGRDFRCLLQKIVIPAGDGLLRSSGIWGGELSPRIGRDGGCRLCCLGGCNHWNLQLWSGRRESEALTRAIY